MIKLTFLCADFVVFYFLHLPLLECYSSHLLKRPQVFSTMQNKATNSVIISFFKFRMLFLQACRFYLWVNTTQNRYKITLGRGLSVQDIQLKGTQHFITFKSENCCWIFGLSWRYFSTTSLNFFSLESSHRDHVSDGKLKHCYIN